MITYPEAARSARQTLTLFEMAFLALELATTPWLRIGVVSCYISAETFRISILRTTGSVDRGDPRITLPALSPKT
jgi:hypothetical protein